MPAHPWPLRLCVLLLTNAKDAQKVDLMAVLAVMVLHVQKAKANAAMAVVQKVEMKAAIHVVAVVVSVIQNATVNAVRSVVLNVVQSVVQSAVTKSVLIRVVLKAEMRVATRVVAHVTPTDRAVAARVRKPVQMLKAN